MASQSLGQNTGRTHRVLLVQKNNRGEASVVKSEQVVTEEATKRRASETGGSALLTSRLDVAFIESPVFPENGVGRTSDSLTRERNAASPLANDAEQEDKEGRWQVQKVVAVAQPVNNMAQSPPRSSTRAK